MEHPNFEVDSKENNSLSHKGLITGDKKSSKGHCIKTMKRLDYMIIKPLLIYRYNKDQHKRRQEFMDLFMKKGDMLEDIFMKD